VDYENLVSDFAQRTKANLELVDREARRGATGTAFEVTQLVNSMLGLLVFPQQRWFDRIPKTPMSELVDAGWPSITVYGEVPGNDLRGLSRYLRNGITHFNIRFLPDTSGRITGLAIWNAPRNGAERNWEANLSVAALRFIALEFISMLSDRHLPLDS
jgi:hypothetical protein